MSLERWRQVPGYEGRYDVSDQGRVRSWISYLGNPYIFQPHLCGGYPSVLLSPGDGQVKKNAKIHQLVVLAFIGPRPDGLVTRHLDGDRTNNVLSNLTYGTVSENRLDTVRHGRHNHASKTHCPASHPYDDENTKRDSLGRRSCRECGRARARARYAA